MTANGGQKCGLRSKLIEDKVCFGPANLLFCAKNSEQRNDLWL